MAQSKIDYSLVQLVKDAEAAYTEARRRLSEHLVSLADFKPGDIVRDKDTGARYRIDGMSGYVHHGRPNLDLQATRVYTTGRSPATSTSFISASRMELVEKAE